MIRREDKSSIWADKQTTPQFWLKSSEISILKRAVVNSVSKQFERVSPNLIASKHSTESRPIRAGYEENSRRTVFQWDFVTSGQSGDASPNLALFDVLLKKSNVGAAFLESLKYLTKLPPQKSSARQTFSSNDRKWVKQTRYSTLLNLDKISYV